MYKFLCLTGGVLLVCCLLGLAFAQNADKQDEKALIEAFVNLKDVPQPFAQTLAELKTKYDAGELWELRQLGLELLKNYLEKEKIKVLLENKPFDLSGVPYLIALIDADNSQEIYGVGGYLASIAGVKFSQFQDGAFWKRWWERNKANFPEEIQKIKIPELPKTTHGKSYEPYPEKMETLDGLLEYLCERFSPENFTAKNRKDVRVVQEGLLKFRLEFNSSAFSGLASAIAEYNDPKAIPYLIGAIDADNSYATVYFLGYFGLRELTEIKEYSIFHDGAFWRRWWEKNKTNFPDEVQKIAIPDLPKTPHGKSYVPYPENTETIDGVLKYLCSCFEPENQKKINSGYMFGVAQAIAQFDDPKAIPYLIGAIDADNSYVTVYGLGYFGLSRLTGVEVQYSAFHDGAFWRRWWERNKINFPEEVQKIAIPDLPKTQHGKTYEAFPESMETLDGLLQYLRSCFAPENREKMKKPEGGLIFQYLAEAIAKYDDPKAIPYLISAIDAADTGEATSGIYRGLSTLTGTLSPSWTGEWWKNWWEENKQNYPEAVQNIPIPSVHDEWVIPDLSTEVALWREERAEAERRKQDEQWLMREEQMLREIAASESDVADVPFERLHVEGNEKMRYFLIGVDQEKPVPESGYRLVVVMPGGNGGVLFHPFVRRIWKYAMDESDGTSKYIIAQPIAVRWTPNQQIVWATENVKVENQEFSTETFVESVVADVSNRVKIDPKYVFTFSWSSSGPAAYAIALQEKTAITGSYIVMSVFKPNELPPLENAKGRLFAIQHSPEDRVCPFRMAKEAEEQLTEHGATVKFMEYPGGHGWSGNVYGRIRENLDWLQTHTANVNESRSLVSQRLSQKTGNTL